MTAKVIPKRVSGLVVKTSKEMAESLGYSVINYIMEGGMSKINNTNF